MALTDLPLAPAPVYRRRRSGSIGRRVLGYAVLTLAALIALLPFAWMLSTSLKHPEEVFVFPPQWLPKHFVWSNYRTLWRQLPIGHWILNSAYVTVVAVGGRVVLSSLSAYAFARLRFPGRDYLFFGFLTALMIPWEVTLIPGFVLMKELGWVDTHFALIVPKMGDVFSIFLLRQFFLSLPRELEDAARIDGAGYLRIYWSIILPLSRSALAVVAALGFMNVWNDFLWPLVVLNTPAKFTLPVGLQLLSSAHTTDWNVLMAGDVISLLPVVVVYLCAQKYFVQGITTTGLKG